MYIHCDQYQHANFKNFFLPYWDRRNQLYSDIQADSICANLLIYHLEIILINSSGGKTNNFNYNELILHVQLYIKVHSYLLFCCVIRDYLALNVYVALCYYKLDYYDVSQASIIKFDFLFFCVSNLVPIKYNARWCRLFWKVMVQRGVYT